jgi:hypothetical protein
VTVALMADRIVILGGWRPQSLAAVPVSPWHYLWSLPPTAPSDGGSRLPTLSHESVLDMATGDVYPNGSVTFCAGSSWMTMTPIFAAT